MQYGQDVASKFASAFMQAKKPEAMMTAEPMAEATVEAMAQMTAEMTVTAGLVDTAAHLKVITMESDSPGKTKATEKCQVKSSMRGQSVPVNNSRGEVSAPETKAGPVTFCQPEETEATTNVMTVTSGSDTSNKPLVDIQMLNQVREMVFYLLNQSKILDECRVRVARAISKAVSKHTTKLFQPFTTYISDVSNAVETCCRKVMVIRPEMAHCDYDTYRTCSASV